jgi:hypothetical protein
MEIRYTSELLKQSNGLTWLDRLVGANRVDTHGDLGSVLLDGCEVVGVFPDRVVADRVRYALELLDASESADSKLAQMKRIVEYGV